MSVHLYSVSDYSLPISLGFVRSKLIDIWKGFINTWKSQFLTHRQLSIRVISTFISCLSLICWSYLFPHIIGPVLNYITIALL